MIKVSLENSSGSLNLTDVTVAETEMPMTKALTDKNTPTKPTAKTMTGMIKVSLENSSGSLNNTKRGLH